LNAAALRLGIKLAAIGGVRWGRTGIISGHIASEIQQQDMEDDRPI
jgi:hypothetical protein